MGPAPPIPSLTSTAVAESSAAGGGAFDVGLTTGPFGMGASTKSGEAVGPLGINPLYLVGAALLAFYIYKKV